MAYVDAHLSLECLRDFGPYLAITSIERRTRRSLAEGSKKNEGGPRCKGNVMKPENVFYLIAALVIALSAISHWQSNASQTVKADTSFEFVLGDTTSQPGPYEVSVTGQDTVWIKGTGTSIKAVNSQAATSLAAAKARK